MSLQPSGIKPKLIRPNYRRYWLALYRRDVATAERVVDAAMAAWSPQRVYLRLFEPAQSQRHSLGPRPHPSRRRTLRHLSHAAIHAPRPPRVRADGDDGPAGTRDRSRPGEPRHRAAHGV